jgi:hypothetical protein
VIKKPLGLRGHSPRWAAVLENNNNNNNNDDDDDDNNNNDNNNNNNFCGIGCVTLHGHCKRKQRKKWEFLNSSCACVQILKTLPCVERNTEII